MSSEPSAPPAPFTAPLARQGFRLPRTGPHAAGKAVPILYGRREPTFKRGRRPAKAPREGLIAESVRDGNAIACQRQQDRLVRDFVESLTGDERAFAESTGLAKPLADALRFDSAPAAQEHEQPFTEEFGVKNGRHSLVPHGHPVIDALEPIASVAVEELSPGQILEAHQTFAGALAWIHEAKLLVKKGRRLAALIAFARPDLADGLPVEAALRDELVTRLDGDSRQLGLVFGRVFAWCREASSLGALGLRSAIIAYVIRPELLDAATNAQLGSPTDVTRQAINKLVGEFRDTFAGLRAPSMRSEDTRTRCRAAQLG